VTYGASIASSNRRAGLMGKSAAHGADCSLSRAGVQPVAQREQMTTVRRSKQETVRQNRQAGGRQALTRVLVVHLAIILSVRHGCPVRCTSHRITVHRRAHRPRPLPVAASQTGPSRAASRAFAVRTQRSAHGRTRTRHEGYCVAIASAIAAREGRARAISALFIARGAPSRREPANRKLPSRQHKGRAARTHSLGLAYANVSHTFTFLFGLYIFFTCHGPKVSLAVF